MDGWVRHEVLAALRGGQVHSLSSIGSELVLQVSQRGPSDEMQIRNPLTAAHTRGEGTVAFRGETHFTRLVSLEARAADRFLA